MTAKKVYICGIGGIGTSAVAKYFHAQGAQVMGSDVSDSVIIQDLKTLGVQVFLKQDASQIPSDIDLFIYTQAAPNTNSERVRADELGVTQFSYQGFLAHLSHSFKTIAVSGTKGKTTTTALIALVMQAAQKEPTLFIGGMIPSFPLKNTRVGKSDVLVMEQCEYRAVMLTSNPSMIVLTNLYHDHPDFYRDLEHVEEVFGQYVKRLPQKGVLIWNADDPASTRVVQKAKEWLDAQQIRCISYGKGESAQIRFSSVSVESGIQKFIVTMEGKQFPFEMKVPGEFNVYNACAMMAVGTVYGISVSVMQQVLAGFTGTWRRFELVGERNGALIYTDYAHTPESVDQAIRAAKDFYPDRRLLVAFQPHQYARTEKLFNDFVKAFDAADRLLLVDIYDVAGREEKKTVSSLQLANEVKKRGVDVMYTGSVQASEEAIKKEIQPNDIVFIVGAGDIYSIVQKLV